jgi:UDP-2,3-diacylglucosamine hydrolase
MPTLIVSDLHIDSATPGIADRFVAFLDREAPTADALYILGDLFESWIGDDDDDPHRLAVVEALARLTRSGVELYVQAGNRDFLYGDRFAARTGARRLEDPTRVTRYGRTVLMTHGDALCTDDLAYQRLRAMVRDDGWQRAFLGLARATRQRLAEAARSGSRAHTRQQSSMLMDVNAKTVEAVFRAADVDTLIHGHTHRPAVHTLVVDGRVRERIVTGDWSGTATFAVWDESGIRLATLPAH